jgi:hypothetical protein
MQEDATKSTVGLQQYAEPVFPQVRQGFFLHADRSCCTKTVQPHRKKTFGVASKAATP